MKPALIRDLVAALLVLVSLICVAYLAIVQRDATAVGAIITLLSPGGAWFLRGRVSEPHG